MKVIRIIAIVVVLLAAGCRSSADEATLISSTDATSSANEADGAADTGAEATQVDQADGSDAALNGEDSATGERSDDADNGDERATDDPESRLDHDSVATGLLARTSDATVEASTGRFEGRLVVTAAPDAEVTGTFDLSVAGSYDVAAQAFDVTVDLSGLSALAADASTAEADMFASMFADPVKVRSIGGTAWVRWGLLRSMLGAATADGGTAWLEATADEAASMTGSFGVDTPDSPTDILEALAELDATVREVGRETVRGTEATHYEIVIDLEAATAGLSSEEQAALSTDLPGAVSGELPIDLWIDDEGLLRRLVIELDDLDSLGLGSDAEDISSVLIEFEIFDVGEAIDIEPPPADQVITTDDLGFGLDGGF